MNNIEKSIEALAKEFDQLKQEYEALKIAYSNEIAERSLTEEKLSFSQYAVECITDSIIWVNQAGKLVFVNNATCTNLGYTQEELLAMRIFDINPFYTSTEWDKNWIQLLEKKSITVETFHKTKESQLIPIEVTSNLINHNGINYSCAVIRDISIQQKLETESTILRNLIKFNPLSVQIFDSNGYTLEVNESFVRLFGAVPPPYYSIFEDTLLINQGLGELVQRFKVGETVEFPEFPYNAHELLPDDTNVPDKPVYIRMFGFPILNSEGKPEKYVLMHEDILAKKQFELKLKESNELLTLFIKHSPIHTYIKSVTPDESRVIFASDNFLEMIGIESEVMIGRTMAELFPPEFADKITKDDWTVVTNGVVLKIDEHLNNKHYTTIKFPVILGDRHLLAGYTIDITERINMEEALRESEEKFKNIVRMSPTGMYFYNLDSNKQLIFLGGNPAADKINKISHNERIGLTIEEAFPNLVNTNIPEIYKRIASGELESQSFEVEYSEGNFGGYYFTHVFQTQPNTIAIDFIDISDSKKAEEALKESENQYRTLFDTMPNGFYRSTPQGYIVSANPAFVKMLGFDNLDELKSVHVPTQLYVSSEERDGIDADNTEFVNQIETYRLRRKDGQIIWIEDNARYIKDSDGAIKFHEGICKDISERKKAEEEIIRLNENLEHKVIERTAELNDAIRIIEESNHELIQLNINLANESRKLVFLNEKLADSENELKIANQTKDKFFSIIAHDLKNPIGGVRNLLELIMLHHDKMDINEIIKLVSSSHKASVETFNLLENLLEWARIQRKTISFEPKLMDIYSLIAKVLAVVKVNADSKTISIINNMAKDTYAYFDLEILHTIFRNLISNAIKFTNEGGKIEIGILPNFWNQKSQNGFITIFVKDNGIGMLPETVEQLFQIGKSITGKGTFGETGTGLGLILCKEFVEKLKGEIWVESEIGVGSTFYFTVPTQYNNVS